VLGMLHWQRVCRHAVYVGALGGMRGQQIGVRMAAAEGQVVGASHDEGTQGVEGEGAPMSELRAGAVL
jgi:hypothetical protein